MSVVLNTKHLSGFINEEEYKAIYPRWRPHTGSWKPRMAPAMTSWAGMYLPRDYDKEEFARIKEAAQKIREAPKCWSWPASAAAIWVPAL